MSVITQLLQAAADQLGQRVPKQVSIRQLSRQTTHVLSTIAEEKTSALVTFRGVPRYLLVPIDPDRITALLLSGAPGVFSNAVEDGEAALEAGMIEAPTQKVRV